MFKNNITWCSLIILFFIHVSYAKETKVICPTGVVCINNLCDQTILVPPWTKIYNTQIMEPDGTYNFVRVDVYTTVNNEYYVSCWLENPNGNSITITSNPNNVYPDKGGYWSQFSCIDFDKNNPKNCPLIWKHN